MFVLRLEAAECICCASATQWVQLNVSAMTVGYWRLEILGITKVGSHTTEHGEISNIYLWASHIMGNIDQSLCRS